MFGEVPQERVKEALANKGKLAIRMKAPDGSTGYLPEYQAAIAMKNGGIPVTAEPKSSIPPKGQLPIPPTSIPAKIAALMYPGAQMGLEMGMGTATGEDTASERSFSKVTGQVQELLSPRGALNFAMQATPFGAAKTRMDTSRAAFDATQNHTLASEATNQAGAMVGADVPAIQQSAKDKNWNQLAAEIGVPAAELIAGAKVGGRFLKGAAPIAHTELTRSGYTQPVNKISAPSDTDPEIVNRAMPEILKAAKNKPASLMDALSNAGDNINSFFNSLLDRPINTAKPGLKQLPAATAEIPTGASRIVGQEEGGLYPAQSRDVLTQGKPAPGASNIPDAIRQAMARSQAGSMANTVPQSVMGETNPLVSQIGTQAATLPDSLLAGKTEPGVQFLTAADGSPNPGTRTNPAVLQTRDLGHIRSTLQTLEDIAANPEQMASFAPEVRSAIKAKILEYQSLTRSTSPLPSTVGELRTSLDPVVNELRQQAAQMRSIGHGAVADALEAKSHELGSMGDIDLKSLNRMRQVENANSNVYFSKDNLGQFIDADKSKAQSIISRTMDKFARETLYRELEQAHPDLAKGSIAEMKRNQGALITIEQNLKDSIARTRTEAAKSLGTDVNLRLQQSVRPMATRSGINAHIGGISEATRPRAVGELNSINNSGELFQPRSSPFAPVHLLRFSKCF